MSQEQIKAMEWIIYIEKVLHLTQFRVYYSNCLLECRKGPLVSQWSLVVNRQTFNGDFPCSLSW